MSVNTINLQFNIVSTFMYLNMVSIKIYSINNLMIFIWCHKY